LGAQNRQFLLSTALRLVTRTKMESVRVLASVVALALMAASAQAAYVVSAVRPSQRTAGDAFGWAVASSGTVLVVGAPGTNTAAGADAGAAYVFDCTVPTACAQQFVMSGTVAGGQLGYAVAIYGATVMVGAPGVTYSGNMNVPGAVYVWDCTYLNACVQRSTLAFTAAGYSNIYNQPYTLAKMGAGLAVYNALVFVGGPAVSGTACTYSIYGSPNGYAYTSSSYECSGAQTFNCPTLATCTRQGTLGGDLSMSTSTRMNSEYGASVALYQWTAVVGAPGTVGVLSSMANVGTAYVLDCSAVTSCTTGSVLVAPSGMTGDRFGTSVAISRSAVVVGAAGNGKAYLFLCVSATNCTFLAQLTSVYGSWPNTAIGLNADVIPLSVTVPPFAVGIYYNGTAVVVGPTVYSCDMVTGTCVQRASLAATMAASAASTPGASVSNGRALGFAVAVSMRALFASDIVDSNGKGVVYAFTCPASGTVIDSDCFDAPGAPAPTAAPAGPTVPVTASPTSGVAPTVPPFATQPPGGGGGGGGGSTGAPPSGMCPTGWGGAGCSNCAVGYYGPSCASSCDACINGYCASGTRGGCICFSGFAGARCSDCAAGFGGPQCTPVATTAPASGGGDSASSALVATTAQYTSLQYFGIAMGVIGGLVALLVLIGAGLVLCYMYVGRPSRRAGKHRTTIVDAEVADDISTETLPGPGAGGTCRSATGKARPAYTSLNAGRASVAAAPWPLLDMHATAARDASWRPETFDLSPLRRGAAASDAVHTVSTAAT
jgi:hypothetical protein